MTAMKFGLISTANIARKNVRAMKLSEHVELVAIASRSIEKCEQFANENDLNDGSVKLYASYEELLSDPNIDAVYLPLPTSLHLEWAKKVAQSKKHLLIEKPCALNSDELIQIMTACHENKVYFMDGVMFMHHDRLNVLRKALKDPFAGEVMRVNTFFSFNGLGGGFGEDNKNIRTSASGDPLGVLGDLGWYCIRIALVAFSQGNDQKQIKMPISCKATGDQWAEKVVPLDMSAIVYFNEKKNQKLYIDASFLLPFRQRFEICSVGKYGVADKVITCDDFVIPRVQNDAFFVRETSGGSAGALSDHDCCINTIRETFTSNTRELGNQEVNMFSQFAILAAAFTANKDKRTNELNYWHKISLATQLVVDAVLMSMAQGGIEVNIKPLPEGF